MGSFYDMIGFVFSLLGMFGTLQKLYSIAQRYLPSHQLKLLEDIFV